MNKRERMLNLLPDGTRPDTTPAAFFLHFEPQFHRGAAAIEKHLEFFHATDMDFVKIQYEQPVAEWGQIETITDWGRIPRYDADFFAGMLQVADGLIKTSQAEALILMTLYSPFMWARRIAGDERLSQHIHDNMALVQKGLETLTANVQTFVRACIDLGIDGFYASTQGGERHRFPDVRLFEAMVKPYDLIIMNEINERCRFNILHVCDYQGAYNDFSRFVAYPGHVVNSPLQVNEQPIAPRAVATLFNRPYMGGMDRLGVLATGTPEQIRAEAEEVIRQAPERFILAADCTVPAETPWSNLRLAVDTAHQYRKTDMVQVSLTNP